MVDVMLVWRRHARKGVGPVRMDALEASYRHKEADGEEMRVDQKSPQQDRACRHSQEVQPCRVLSANAH